MRIYSYLALIKYYLHLCYQDFLYLPLNIFKNKYENQFFYLILKILIF